MPPPVPTVYNFKHLSHSVFLFRLIVTVMNTPFDVTELDRTVKAFYEGNDTRRQAAQAVITDFQKDPNSWQIVDQILEQSSYLQTKV